MNRYVAFLRGINVGGHKKVPMQQLHECMTEMGFTKIKTLLASGNVVFEAEHADRTELTEKSQRFLNRSLVLKFLSSYENGSRWRL